MLTRADTLTNNKKTEFFSDFLDSFAKTPYGNQLGRVVNEKSVNQSLKNLLLTNLGERLYQPTIGSNIINSLFELNLVENRNTLEFFIETTIKNNEPRVIPLQISVNSTDNENQIQIQIVYTLINNPTPISFSFLLKRAR
ncbi:baseplate wedge subunit [uncultured Caudovirales phage]|uniref:Baseplate wedge subunit n=1 Tax=uncultured Caudovirales phage TaxID=2100421 RepID=A0A6J5NTM0_9CAUD|nr:baseplate wedge subunit [uncultured Caudovirales phage]